MGKQVEIRERGLEPKLKFVNCFVAWVHRMDIPQRVVYAAVPVQGLIFANVLIRADSATSISNAAWALSQ